MGALMLQYTSEILYIRKQIFSSSEEKNTEMKYMVDK